MKEKETEEEEEEEEEEEGRNNLEVIYNIFFIMTMAVLLTTQDTNIEMILHQTV